MDDAEIRLRCIEALISKAPQSPDVGTLIERAKVLIAFINPDNPQGPGRRKGTLSIAADNGSPPAKEQPQI